LCRLGLCLRLRWQRLCLWCLPRGRAQWRPQHTLAPQLRQCQH
jgi:hypothetical protein